MLSNQDIDKQVTQIFQTGDLTKLLSKCEELEIEAGQDPKHVASTFFYSSFLLAYYIHDDLDNARFLWKRIPENAKKSQELQNVWKIGQFMWKREYADVYKTLANVQWSNPIQPLIQAFNKSYREKMFKLIAKAYTNITVQDLAVFLGQTVDQAKKIAQDAGWKFDEPSQTFEPVPLIEEEEKKTKSSLDYLTNLTDRALFLELQ